jgi:hypothetical protein
LEVEFLRKYHKTKQQINEKDNRYSNYKIR